MQVDKYTHLTSIVYRSEIYSKNMHENDFSPQVFCYYLGMFMRQLGLQAKNSPNI